MVLAEVMSEVGDRAVNMGVELLYPNDGTSLTVQSPVLSLSVLYLSRAIDALEDTPELLI